MGSSVTLFSLLLYLNNVPSSKSYDHLNFFFHKLIKLKYKGPGEKRDYGNYGIQINNSVFKYIFNFQHFSENQRAQINSLKIIKNYKF